MLVTPIAAPSPASSEVGNQAHSPSAVERAKQAFAGVQISRSDTPEDPAITKKRESIRTLKMKTQASPERYLQEIKESLPAQENAISDIGGQTNAATEETKPLSPQYAALARERRALQVKERELAARQKALESQAPRNDASEVLSRLKAQPLSVLEEAGVTYDDLTQAILGSQANPEMRALEDKIKSLEQSLETRFTERTTQEEQQVLASMRNDAYEIVKSPEFETLAKTPKSIEKYVLPYIERWYRETGEVLEVEDAMKDVENTLFNDYFNLASSINKLKNKMLPPPVQPQQQQSQTRQMRTLTNRDTAVPPMSAKARAIAAFLGNLKK